MSAFIAFFSLLYIKRIQEPNTFYLARRRIMRKKFLYFFSLIGRPLIYQARRAVSLAAVSINSTLWQIRAFFRKPESHFLRHQISFAPTRAFLQRPYPIITKKRYFLCRSSCFGKSRSEKLRLTWTPDKQYVQYLRKEPFPVLVYPIRLKQDKIFGYRNWKVRQTIILALFKNF